MWHHLHKRESLYLQTTDGEIHQFGLAPRTFPDGSEVDKKASRAYTGFKVLTGRGAQIDTTTPNGRLIFGIFATLAEFERELIAERTKAGLAAARARGRKGGRPRKMDVNPP